MKQRNAILILVPVLLLALLLAGCGGSSASYNSMKPESTTAYSSAGSSPGYAYDAPEEAAYETAPTTQAATLNANVPANVKMIYTAEITLESTEFDGAANALAALTAELGGWYESSRLDNYSRYRSAYYTVRVPAEQFETFCTRVGDAATLRNISRAAEDVSERYYDVESRLATQRTKLERLQALLAQAEEMEDIITLESAISETELSIENLTGSLRKYDSLVGYSTIQVSLNEVYKATEPEIAPIGFGARLSSAFREGTEDFVDGFQDFLVDLASVWLGLLVFLVIVAVVILLIVRGKRRRKREPKPPRKAGRGKKARSAESAEQDPGVPQQSRDT